MTNLEYIRTCTTAELADLLCAELDMNCFNCVARGYCYDGHTGFIDWLDEKRGDDDEWDG